MLFNSFVYFLCGVWTTASAVLHLLDWKWRRRGTARHHNAEFMGFQRQFFLGYLPCLFAECLQAPYLYFLYQSYGFLESQISVLYVSGFITNVFFGVVVMFLVQRFGRKLLALIFVGLNSISCMMKFSDSYGVLLVSRVLDGVASALLVTPFEDWYVHEHTQTFDFPKEWIPVTFRQTAMAHGYLAVAAGFMAEASETWTRTTAFPFLLAIPILIGSGFFMFRDWPENRLEPGQRPRFWPQFSRAIRGIARSPNIFLLSAVQSLFESTLYMFVFLWTPLFLYLKPLLSSRPTFGGIYSTLMASALFGSVLQRLLSRRLSSVSILNVSTALAFVSMAIVVAITSSSPSVLQFQVVLAVFCTYELAVGLYFPAVQRLQREILPKEDRGAILTLFRIPLNLLAAAGLLILHSREKVDGNWMILIICMVLLALCFMASLLLQGLVKKTGPDINQLLFHLNAPDSDEDT